MIPQLDKDKISQTVDTLTNRIRDRFPESGLLEVSEKLHQTSLDVSREIEVISRPAWLIRCGVWLFIIVVLGFLGYAISEVDWNFRQVGWGELVQVLEALFNNLLLIGGAILFLMSIENWKKRRRVVLAVNRLRCLAHVVDMHQLTKDPAAVGVGPGKSTKHSPKRTMTPFELSRYLDYCSEMLSLISKVGFLYVQNYDDPQAVNAVNELETMSNGLSRKIWQKIMLIKSDQNS